VSSVTQQGPDPFRFFFNVPNVTLDGIKYRLDAKDLVSTRTIAFPAPDTSQFQTVTVGGVEGDITPAGGTLILKSGVLDNTDNYNECRLDVPAGALSSPAHVSIHEVAAPNNPGTVPPALGSRFALTPNPHEAFEILPKGLPFNLPVLFKLMYIADGDRLLGTTFDINQAQAFTHDGYEWKPMDAAHDKLKHTFTAHLAHLSLYGVFPSLPLDAVDFRPPQKIITPNGDGINDTLEFGNLDPETVIDIFDVNGRRVRHMQGMFVWDGRDDSGNIVESGVYIYQFKKDGKVVSGVVAVAK